MGRARALCREAIDKLRETWTDSENEGAQRIFDALTALDTQLRTLKIDTTGWNKCFRLGTKTLGRARHDVTIRIHLIQTRKTQQIQDG